MTALEPRSDLAALEHMDPAVREQAVTQYLERARDQLTLAMNLNGPEAVAAVKAEIATAAEATRQLGLSKEIQTDAQEMVRRAEYALGKAIRAGQERGEINSLAAPGNRPRSDYVRGGTVIHVGDVPDRNTSSPTDFIPNASERDAVYRLADAREVEFEAALSDAREEGKLSRANVVRKIKGVKSEGLTPVEKLSKIRELAPTGRTSTQIAREVGCSEEYVRELARRNDIEITADKVLGRPRRVDSNRIVQETVSALEGLAIGLKLVNYDDVDATQANDWAISLSDSIRALNRLAKQIKEMTQ